MASARVHPAEHLATAAGFYLSAALPLLFGAAAMFITPMAFLVSTARNSRLFLERLALGLGLVIGPAAGVLQRRARPVVDGYDRRLSGLRNPPSARGLAMTTGLEAYLALILVGFLPSEVWRWLGVLLGRGLDEQSEIILWVRAVATALVASSRGAHRAVAAGRARVRSADRAARCHLLRVHGISAGASLAACRRAGGRSGAGRRRARVRTLTSREPSARPRRPMPERMERRMSEKTWELSTRIEAFAVTGIALENAMAAQLVFANHLMKALIEAGALSPEGAEDVAAAHGAGRRKERARACQRSRRGVVASPHGAGAHARARHRAARDRTQIRRAAADAKGFVVFSSVHTR